MEFCLLPECIPNLNPWYSVVPDSTRVQDTNCRLRSLLCFAFIFFSGLKAPSAPLISAETRDSASTLYSQVSHFQENTWPKLSILLSLGNSDGFFFCLYFAYLVYHCAWHKARKLSIHNYYSGDCDSRLWKTRPGSITVAVFHSSLVTGREHCSQALYSCLIFLSVKVVILHNST